MTHTQTPTYQPTTCTKCHAAIVRGPAMWTTTSGDHYCYGPGHTRHQPAALVEVTR